MPNVVVTGFEPFGNESTNPTMEVIQQLDGEIILDHRVIAVPLAVESQNLHHGVQKTIDLDPDLIINLGLCGGRTSITLERIAINILDFPIPDNLGFRPTGQPIRAEGPTGYFTHLPVKAIASELRGRSHPARISYTAGTYLCNQLMYLTLDGLHHRAHRARAGFIHVPYSGREAARHLGAAPPSMDIVAMTDAIRTAIHVSLSTATDLDTGEGEIC